MARANLADRPAIDLETRGGALPMLVPFEIHDQAIRRLHDKRLCALPQAPQDVMVIRPRSGDT